MAFIIYPNLGLTWISDADPTVAPGVPAPLNQFLVRTDIPSFYYKSGNADTAWTALGSGGGGTSIIKRVTYVATGAEGSDFPVPIGTVLPSDVYSVLCTPGGVTLIPVLDCPDILAGDRTTSTFRAITSAAIAAGDTFDFVVLQ